VVIPPDPVPKGREEKRKGRVGVERRNEKKGKMEGRGGERKGSMVKDPAPNVCDRLTHLL
jgi:hypothetical protein